MSATSTAQGPTASHAITETRVTRWRERPQCGVLEIPLAHRRFAELHEDLLTKRWEQLQRAGEKARRALDGRPLWSLNSRRAAVASPR